MLQLKFLPPADVLLLLLIKAQTRLAIALSVVVLIATTSANYHLRRMSVEYHRARGHRWKLVGHNQPLPLFVKRTFLLPAKAPLQCSYHSTATSDLRKPSKVRLNESNNKGRS